MQPDPSKQGYDNYGNNYMNPYPPMGAGNVYPPNNVPPPAYSPYPQQPPNQQVPVTLSQGQTQTNQQQTAVLPVYYLGWNNAIATPMTSNLKLFFVVSGLICLISGILDIGLEIGILITSYSTYYRGLWTGGYLIGVGITMLIAASKMIYFMNKLIRIFIIGLILVLLGLILSIINLADSNRCNSYYWFTCDDQLATNLKIAILIVFIISTIQTIANVIVARNAQRRAILTTVSSAPSY